MEREPDPSRNEVTFDEVGPDSEDITPEDFQEHIGKYNYSCEVCGSDAWTLRADTDDNRATALRLPGKVHEDVKGPVVYYYLCLNCGNLKLFSKVIVKASLKYDQILRKKRATNE